VYGGITPSLRKITSVRNTGVRDHGGISHFVVESACGVEIVEEVCICGPAPEIHVCNLEVAPD
jgi:hypothetical protein